MRRTEKMRLDIALGCFVFVVKVKAKEKGVKGYNKMRKAELVETLQQ